MANTAVLVFCTLKETMSKHRFFSRSTAALYLSTPSYLVEGAPGAVCTLLSTYHKFVTLGARFAQLFYPRIPAPTKMNDSQNSPVSTDCKGALTSLDKQDKSINSSNHVFVVSFIIER